MNKQEVLFTNAICIKSVPEILPLMAIFSGLDEALSNAMNSFVKLFDSKADDVVLDNIFDEQMSDFALEILVQIKSTFPAVIKQYKTNIHEIADIQKAANLSNIINTQYPYLKPLSEELSAQDILAYSSLIKDTSTNLVSDFIEIFTPLAALIQSDIDSKEQAEVDFSNGAEAAIIDNDLDLFKTYVRKGFNIDSILPSNVTPLIRSIEYKSYDILDCLIKNNVAPHCQKTSHSGVAYCVETQDEKALTILIKSKHNVLETCNWQDLLQNNIRELSLALCILIYREVTEKVDFANLIHQAFNAKNMEVLDFLLSKTDDPNSKHFLNPTNLSSHP